MNPRDVARDYDAGAPDFDERFARNPATVERFRRIEAPMLAALRGRVLDLGCGTGRLLPSLGAAVGIDVSFGLLRTARARGFPVLRADAHALPFAAGSFDGIIAANGVFRYLDPPQALAECARVLGRAGRLAVHHLAARTLRLTRPRPSHPGHLRSPDDLLLPARAAGFRALAVHLFRGLRFYPYVVRLPRLVAGRLWDHAVFVLEKR